MSKYTDPSSLMDRMLEAAAGLLVLAVMFWLIVWIIAKIWLWILLAIGFVVVVSLVVRYVRWRRQW